MDSIQQKNSKEKTIFNDALLDLESQAMALFKLLDENSNIIREVERRLQELNVNFPFLFLIQEEQESLLKHPEERHKLSTYLEFKPVYSYTTKILWYLSWDKDEVSQKYRLLLISKEKEIIWHKVSFGCLDPSDFQTTTIFKKPLIETDRETRLRYSSELKPFIYAFSNFLKQYHGSIKFANYVAEQVCKKQKNANQEIYPSDNL
jgi:hypothetical protein